MAHPFLLGRCQGKCSAEASLLHGLFMWECVGPVCAFNSCWLANLHVGALSWAALVRDCLQQPELGVPFLGWRYGGNGDSRNHRGFMVSKAGGCSLMCFEHMGAAS